MPLPILIFHTVLRPIFDAHYKEKIGLRFDNSFDFENRLYVLLQSLWFLWTFKPIMVQREMRDLLVHLFDYGILDLNIGSRA